MLEGGVATMRSMICTPLGIVLWENMSRLNSFHGMNPVAVVHSVKKDGMRSTLHDGCSLDLKLLVKDCWNADIELSSDFPEIIRHFRTILPEE